jgi:hypothetical protein
VLVEVELNAASIPGMHEKYSPSTLGAIFMPLVPTVVLDQRTANLDFSNDPNLLGGHSKFIADDSRGTTTVCQHLVYILARTMLFIEA